MWEQGGAQESLRLVPRLTVGQHIYSTVPARMGTGRSELVFLCIVWMETSSDSELLEISCLAVWGWRAELLTLLQGCSRVAVGGVGISSKSLLRHWIDLYYHGAEIMFLSLLWQSWWGFVPPGVLAAVQCFCIDGQNHAGNISQGLGREMALCVASCPLKLLLFTFKDENAACCCSWGHH